MSSRLSVFSHLNSAKYSELGQQVDKVKKKKPCQIIISSIIISIVIIVVVVIIR